MVADGWIGDRVRRRAVGAEIDFQQLFIDQERTTRKLASLADVLEILEEKWPGQTFMANVVASVINNRDRGEDGQTLRDFLLPGADTGHVFSANSIGMRLNKYVDGPVYSGERTIVLRSEVGPHSKTRVSGRGPRSAEALMLRDRGTCGTFTMMMIWKTKNI